jgi:hypothetical protein
MFLDSGQDLGIWEEWSYLRTTMVTSRFAVFRALLLLVFSLGLLGFACAGTAMAAERPIVAAASAIGGVNCPGDHQQSGQISDGGDCAIAFCRNVQISPALGTATAFHRPIIFYPELLNIGSGLFPHPDPRPPRPQRHTQ